MKRGDLLNIVVFSDSHIKYFSGTISEIFLDACLKSDMVIGLGDYVSEDFYLYIKEISKTSHFIQGNCDDYLLKNKLPLFKSIEIHGLKIHLTHGWGSRNGLEKRILNTLKCETDIVLFGHKHEYVDVNISGIRFINPGTCIPGGTFISMDITGEGKVSIKKRGL